MRLLKSPAGWGVVFAVGRGGGGDIERLRDRGNDNDLSKTLGQKREPWRSSNLERGALPATPGREAGSGR